VSSQGENGCTRASSRNPQRHAGIVAQPATARRSHRHPRRARGLRPRTQNGTTDHIPRPKQHRRPIPRPKRHRRPHPAPRQHHQPRPRPEQHYGPHPAPRTAPRTSLRALEAPRASPAPRNGAAGGLAPSTQRCAVLARSSERHAVLTPLPGAARGQRPCQAGRPTAYGGWRGSAEAGLTRRYACDHCLRPRRSRGSRVRRASRSGAR
jgi:hypothetical protein